MTGGLWLLIMLIAVALILILIMKVAYCCSFGCEDVCGWWAELMTCGMWLWMWFRFWLQIVSEAWSDDRDRFWERFQDPVRHCIMKVFLMFRALKAAALCMSVVVAAGRCSVGLGREAVCGHAKTCETRANRRHKLYWSRFFGKNGTQSVSILSPGCRAKFDTLYDFSYRDL